MISILMPVFNTPKEYFEKSLDSIYSQTVQNFELVIVDNGSTKIDTIKTLEDCKNKLNCKVFYCERQIKKRNISVALNYGLEKCSYNFIARMDSDDIMHKDRLEKQILYMLTNPEVDICGAQIINTLTKEKSQHKKIIPKNEYLFSNWFLNHPTVMFKKDKILSLGGYPETPEYAPEDLLLWIKALKADFIIHNLEEVLLDYRFHGNNISQADSRNQEWNNAILEARK